MTIDSTGTAAVDSTYFWQPISTCPANVKVQLMAEASGVAVYGVYTGRGVPYWTHWAPLPKLSK